VLPVLLLWSWSQSVTTATGQYSFGWLPDGSDFVYPLGEYNASKPDEYKDYSHIIPAPIVDAGKTTLGTLTLTALGVVGTPSINWRMGIGWAYLMPTPAFKGAVPLMLKSEMGEN
jgi:hypothetical protein